MVLVASPDVFVFVTPAQARPAQPRLVANDDALFAEIVGRVNPSSFDQVLHPDRNVVDRGDDDLANLLDAPGFLTTQMGDGLLGGAPAHDAADIAEPELLVSAERRFHGRAAIIVENPLLPLRRQIGRRGEMGFQLFDLQTEHVLHGIVAAA